MHVGFDPNIILICSSKQFWSVSLIWSLMFLFAYGVFFGQRYSLILMFKDDCFMSIVIAFSDLYSMVFCSSDHKISFETFGFPYLLWMWSLTLCAQIFFALVTPFEYFRLGIWFVWYICSLFFISARFALSFCVYAVAWIFLCFLCGWKLDLCVLSCVEYLFNSAFDLCVILVHTFDFESGF